MPAAGSGRRFGTRLPKQYAPLLGRTVIEWALAPFVADREAIIQYSNVCSLQARRQAQQGDYDEDGPNLHVS